MADTENYTVVQGAVTLHTGRRNPQNRNQAEVVRALKGDTFDAPPESDQVLTLLSQKAIRPTAEATGKEKVTAGTIVKAYRVGALDAPRVVGVVPLTLPDDAASEESAAQAVLIAQRNEAQVAAQVAADVVTV